MASLFISYSRKDIEAARKLTEAFKGQDLAFWIDWEGIPPTVDWWKEIEKGIEEADIFLFLLSPDSCRSDVCRREIVHAVMNGKRLIPVVVRDVKADDAPQELRHLNWIFLRETDDFDAAFRKLITAIQTDYEWVQTHRQLQVKALEWERTNHENSFLLRGKELQDAEQQLVVNASKEPHPTDLQRGYVLESRKASDRQRRITRWIAVAVMISLAVLSLLALAQAGAARRAEATAVANENTAQAASILAVSNEQVALTNEAEANRQAELALSRQLAAQAQIELLANQDRRLSLLYAMEAIRIADAAGVQNPAAEQVFRDAMDRTGGEVLVSPMAENMQYTRIGSSGMTVVKALSPSGEWLAIAHTDSTVHVWDLSQPTPTAQVLSSSTGLLLSRLLFDPQGRFLIGFTSGGSMETWDLHHPDQKSRIIDVELVSAPLGGVAGSPIFSPDGQWLTLAARGTQTIVLNLWEPTEKPVTIPGMFLVAPGIQGRWLIGIESKEINVTAQLWDLRDLGKGPTPLPEAYACPRFLISLDGRWFAAHCNNNVNVWNIEDPAQPQAFSGPLPGYALGAFSADSTQLALFSNRGILEVLDLRSGEKGFPLQSIGQPLSNVRFSPDGRLLAARSGTGSILLWDLSPGTRTPIPTVYHGLGGIEYAVEFFEFTSDGSHIVSVSDDGVTRKWDLSNPYLQSLRLQANGKELPYITSSFFSPDGRWLAFNSEYGVESIRTSALFDLQHLSAGPVPLPMSEGPLLFNPGANQVLLLSKNENQIYTWNLADVAARRLDPVVRDVPGTIIVPAVPDRWLVSQLADNTLQVWDLFAPAAEPKVVRAALPASDSLIKIVTNGKWLWMAGNDATLQRWDLEQPGNAPEMVTPISGFVSAMELSPQGNWLAITDQKTARVWDLRHSAQEPVLDLAADISFGINNHDELLFSTDERRLIVNHGTKIQILNLQNLADEPITLGGVVREMGGMTLSPDGHWLAGKDVLSSELRLWNLQDLASEPMVLQEQSDVFDFSPDGKWLAMSELSKIGLLRLDTQELLALACEAVGSNLSRRQWTEHFPSQREYVPTCPQWPEGKDKIVVITTG